jgi:hypothetical protein
MKTTHPAFWAAGLAGVAFGTALVIVGATTSSEVARLASGYGAMLMGAAIYLLAGLKVRQWVGRRVRVSPQTTS